MGFAILCCNCPCSKWNWDSSPVQSRRTSPFLSRLRNSSSCIFKFSKSIKYSQEKGYSKCSWDWAHLISFPKIQETPNLDCFELGCYWKKICSNTQISNFWETKRQSLGCYWLYNGGRGVQENNWRLAWWKQNL